MAQGEDRFAELSRAAAQTVSRRRALRLAVGGLAGVAFAGVGLGSAGAAPNRCAQVCASEPAGPRRAACKQACKQCGGDLAQMCFGAQIICCPGETSCCESSSGSFCCPANSACVDGECVELFVCPGGPTAENCAAGIVTNCGVGDVCAQVQAVAGGCTCIERICGDPCITDADCSGGTVCVTAPGCCADATPFCGTPCGSAATSSAQSWAA